MRRPSTVEPALIRAVLAGREPAESLPNTHVREALVDRLVAEGWSDAEIAAHTRWSTYTVERIHRRIDARNTCGRAA